jgi:hypothetical protein
LPLLCFTALASQLWLYSFGSTAFASVSFLLFLFSNIFFGVLYGMFLLPVLLCLVDVSIPGDSNVMFLVVLIKRAKKSKKHPDPPYPIIEVSPGGTAFAISEKLVFTANHNVMGKGGAEQEIGLLTEYEDLICKDDIIVATLVASCADYDEDWAAYQRSSGSFTHFTQVCPEHELPVKNNKIGERDFPVGLVTSFSSRKLNIQSFHTKVYQYDIFKQINTSTKRRKGNSGRVVDEKPIRPTERALLVVGGRVKGSCGAAYFAQNNKVVAFHVESLGDGAWGEDIVSESNSYASDRSHTSFHRGLVLCRLPKFIAWYSAIDDVM